MTKCKDDTGLRGKVLELKENKKAKRNTPIKKFGPENFALYGAIVEFVPFGKKDICTGQIVGRVIDTRVPCILLKILTRDGNTYQKKIKDNDITFFSDNDVLNFYKLRIEEAKLRGADYLKELQAQISLLTGEEKIIKEILLKRLES